MEVFNLQIEREKRDINFFINKEFSYFVKDLDNQFLNIHDLSEILGNTVDAKDPYTAKHSEQVANISYLIANALGFSGRESAFIHIGGHLHDVGKIGIPDAVLNKTGKFSPSEWEVMKRHPLIGSKIVEPIEALNFEGGLRDMVLYHHERFDGKGYPYGLKGENIPIGARIISVADTISALIQNRPYRKGCSIESAMKEIDISSGTQLDPYIVKVVLDISEQLKESVL